jgi:predicted metal-dependent phosphoesterase TrpH
MKQSCFTKEGNWYKGNLHTHTTNSDGEFTPAERVKAYKEHGYSFISLNDHNTYSANPELCSDDFILFPGSEPDVSNPAEGRQHQIHVVGVANHPEKETMCEILPEHREVSPTLPWQDLIDEVKARDQIAIIAHPVWSRMSIAEISSLHGYVGIEIYNHTSALRQYVGNADYIIDCVLRQGIKTYIFASDDAHSDWDMFGGWIQVKAKELKHEEIVKQIKAGNFYASRGPEIYDYGIEDGKVYIDCSPCEAIYFVTYEPLGGSVIKSGVTHGEFQLCGHETYVRCECVDKNGKIAYSNPIFFR